MVRLVALTTDTHNVLPFSNLRHEPGISLLQRGLPFIDDFL